MISSTPACSRKASRPKVGWLGESLRQCVLGVVCPQEGADQVPARIAPTGPLRGVGDEPQDDRALRQCGKERLPAQVAARPRTLEAGAAVAGSASLRVVPSGVAVAPQVFQQCPAAAPRTIVRDPAGGSALLGTAPVRALRHTRQFGEPPGTAGLLGHGSLAALGLLLDGTPVRFVAGASLQPPGVLPGHEPEDVPPVEFK